MSVGASSQSSADVPLQGVPLQGVAPPENYSQLTTVPNSIYRWRPQLAVAIELYWGMLNVYLLGVYAYAHWAYGAWFQHVLGTQHSSLHTRIGSNRGNPQSTIIYRKRNILTHSNVTGHQHSWR